MIADILSFKNSVHDLKQKIISTEIDWEQFVTIASNQLILTTSYCRLKNKSLLQYIPKDLEVYLEEITSINRNRNLTFIEEIKMIANIFDAHQINYAFLKGSAFLIGGYYKDISERMIGDIDILVHPDHLEKAYNLLIEEAYSPIEGTFGADFIEHKHLPRLTHKTNIAAVEIHRKLLSKNVTGFNNPIKLLKNKQKNNAVNYLNEENLFHHTILNSEINDRGYLFNTINFRSIYDCLVLLKRSNKKNHTEILFSKYHLSFVAKANIHFSTFSIFKTNAYLKFKAFRYKLKQQYKKLNLLAYKWNKTVRFISIVGNRLLLFISNKHYRNAAIKDSKRIKSIIRKNLFP